LWKAKVPPRIKFWLWLIWHDVIATKDNMMKKVGLDILNVHSLMGGEYFVMNCLQANIL
jgi:hypothetical protein